MKRISVNFILIACFALLLLAIVLPFVANTQFNIGKLLEAKYRWKTADEKFDIAIRLDPLNAEYRVDTGKFYMERSTILKNKIPVLLEAEEKYKKAHELNAHNARCLMELAAVQIELFLADTAEYRKKLVESIEHLKEVFKKDPNHYIFNYDAGRNFLRIWGYLGEEDRRFALERLRHCMELVPWYHERIYTKLWSKTKDFEVMLEVTPKSLKAYENLCSYLIKNNLGEFRKGAVNKIEEYKEKEQPELFVQEKKEKERLLRELRSLAMTGKETGWIGKSESGKSTYRNGNMYWAGTVNTVINVPEGEVIVKIQAKGDKAYNIWPYMIVELEGEEIGETYVDSSDWKGYSFVVNADGGTKVLSVSFLNDDGDWEKGIDRNLYVGKVTVEPYEP